MSAEEEDPGALALAPAFVELGSQWETLVNDDRPAGVGRGVGGGAPASLDTERSSDGRFCFRPPPAPQGGPEAGGTSTPPSAAHELAGALRGRRGARVERDDDPRTWPPSRVLAEGLPPGWVLSPKGRIRRAKAPAPRPERKRRTRHWKRHRARLARPQHKAWRAWVEAVAAELDRLGLVDVAQSLFHCGRLAWVQRCNACGEPAARVRIRAHCDARACPWCSRVRSQEIVRELVAAAPIAAELVAPGPPLDARADELARGLAAELAQTERQVNAWTDEAERLARRAEACGARAVEARGRFERATTRAVAFAARARARGDELAARASAFLRHVRARPSWGWKLVTVSPPWNPSNPLESTPLGLAYRLEDLWQRWRACWASVASVEGLASAFAFVELSENGHLHLHAMFFGPWIAESYWRERAQCMVDVKALRAAPGTKPAHAIEALAREAAKYVTKAPSPTRAQWIAGDGTRSVVHPELAAAWVLAARHRKLSQPYGMAREALAIVRAKETEPHAEPEVCGCCGSANLALAELVATERVARYLGGQWAGAFRARKATKHARIFREAPETIPPRVAVDRGAR